MKPYQFHKFHERSQVEWEAQRACLAEAVMLTERVATESELAKAADVLAQPIEGRQKELFKGKHA